MSRGTIKIMADIVIGERSNLIYEKPENVLAELRDDDSWHYTAQCGVRSEAHGQRPGGRMDVEIKIEQPVDELSEALTLFLARLHQLSGFGNGNTASGPVSEQ